ncbi:hypothetical protein [Sphingomonas sp.]|uniref:hypothetical protein n=1 Tax=Sphingomonas sp. TaxID=28214 RepID=UPI0035BBED00
MIALLLSLAAPPAVHAEPRTALDAERSFAADVQKIGQWAAFKKWAAADAIMFTPRAIRARDWLKNRKEPVRAVEWWPIASWVSCDGTLAASTGGSKWPDGSAGYFTTIWKKQADGRWRWIVDHGGKLQVARRRVEQPVLRTPRCEPHLPGTGDPPYLADPGEQKSWGSSSDGSLVWEWFVARDGERRLSVAMTFGNISETVVDDRVPAPAP